MTFKRVTLFFLIAFICQLSLVNIVSIKAFGPNLVFCVVVIISFLYEDGYRSIPFGMFFGILLDICAGNYAGVTGMAMLTSGIFAAVARRWLNVEKIPTIMTTAVIATVIYELTYFACMKAMGDPLGIGLMSMKLIVYILYNLAVIMLMFTVMHRKAEKYHNDRYSV